MKVGIYVYNILETFYYVQRPPGQWKVLVHKYTETLLEQGLGLENALKLQLLQEQLDSKKIQRWPDFDKEKKLSTSTEELRSILGATNLEKFSLLPKDKEYAKQFEPFVEKLSLTKIFLGTTLLQQWFPDAATRTALNISVQTTLKARAEELKKQYGHDFVKTTYGPTTVQPSWIITLQTVCAQRFGWSVTFKNSVYDYVYFNIGEPLIQFILLLLICTKSTKAKTKEQMQQFATWHNIINYFWSLDPAVQLPGSSLFGLYDKSATLPILFSMPDENKNLFFF